MRLVSKMLVCYIIWGAISCSTTPPTLSTIAQKTPIAPAFNKLIQYEKASDPLKRDRTEYEIVRYEAVIELVQRAELELRSGNSLEALKLLTIAKQYAAYHGQVRSLYDLSLKSAKAATMSIFNSKGSCALLNKRVLFIKELSPDSIGEFSSIIQQCKTQFEKTAEVSLGGSKPLNLNEIIKLAKIKSPPIETADKSTIDKELEKVLEEAKAFPLDEMLLIDIKFLSQIEFKSRRIAIDPDPENENEVGVFVSLDIKFNDELNGNYCSQYKELLDKPHLYSGKIDCLDYGGGLITLANKPSRLDGANVTPIHVSKLFLKKLEKLPVTKSFPEYMKISLQYENGQKKEFSSTMLSGFEMSENRGLLFEFSFLKSRDSFWETSQPWPESHPPYLFYSSRDERPHLKFLVNSKKQFRNQIGMNYLSSLEDSPKGSYLLYFKLSNNELYNLKNITISFDLERTIKEILTSNNITSDLR